MKNYVAIDQICYHFPVEGAVQEGTAEVPTSTSPEGHQVRRPVAPLQAAVQVLEDLAAAGLSAGSCWRTELTSGPTTPRPRPTADPTSGLLPRYPTQEEEEEGIG